MQQSLKQHILTERGSPPDKPFSERGRFHYKEEEVEATMRVHSEKLGFGLQNSSY